jgi:H+/gluconate symporter-like permease
LTVKYYLNKFIELGVLLLAVSVIAEILFGPDVAFFGSQVTKNLISLLDSLGEQGIAALIVVFAVIFTYRRLLK